MRRLAVSTAVSLLVLTGTAAAATTQQGVVLSVGAAGHQIQVVDSSHVVHAYRLAPSARGLAAGAVIAYRQLGNAIAAVHVTGHVRQVSFYASVIKSSGKHLVLRLGDGRTVRFAASATTATPGHHKRDSGRQILAHAAVARAAGTPVVTINIVGLAPGATVLVTETVGAGDSITISISLPTLATAGGTGGGAGGTLTGTPAGAAGEQVVQGTVTQVGAGTFDVQTASGSAFVFTMDPSALAGIGMSPCDTVFVGYHAAGPTLIADNVDDYGTSTAGVCNGNDGSSDETGPITQISDAAVTIDTSDQGPMTFAVDPSSGLTDDFVVGDVVDVTYALDADGVTLDASDIEYIETDSLGLVTAVSADSLTVTDEISGQADVFAADPSEQLFEGIAVGDLVDVTFHETTGQQVVDNVDDLTGDGMWTG